MSTSKLNKIFEQRQKYETLLTLKSLRFESLESLERKLHKRMLENENENERKRNRYERKRDKSSDRYERKREWDKVKR